MTKSSPFEYTETQLGEYILYGERSLLREFKRMDRYEILSEKFSLTLLVGNSV